MSLLFISLGSDARFLSMGKNITVFICPHFTDEAREAKQVVLNSARKLFSQNTWRLTLPG